MSDGNNSKQEIKYKFEYTFSENIVRFLQQDLRDERKSTKKQWKTFIIFILLNELFYVAKWMKFLEFMYYWYFIKRIQYDFRLG